MGLPYTTASHLDSTGPLRQLGLRPPRMGVHVDQPILVAEDEGTE